MMNTNKYKLSFILIILSIFLFCKEKENEEMAVDSNGPITIKDMIEEAQSRNAESMVSENPNLQKRIIKEFSINREVIKLARESKLANTEDFLRMKKVVYLNTLHNHYKNHQQDRLKDEKQKFYHARHIILKLKESQLFMKTTDPKEEKEAYQKIEEIREEIISGKISFEKAAEKYSQDATAKKGGDLGLFMKGTMSQEFQNAVHRLAGEITGNPYRVKMVGKMFSSPSDKDKRFAQVFQNAIVTAKEPEKDGWLKIETAPGLIYYIQTAKTEKLPEENKISAPVRSQFGWHLIELLDVKEKNYKEHIDFIFKEELKDQKNANTALAERKAQNIWKNYLNKALKSYEDNILKKYDITIGFNVKIPDNWQNKEFLIENNNIKIKKSDFIDFLWFISKRNFESLEQTIASDNLKRYYSMFLEASAYSKEAALNKHDLTNEFKKALELNNDKMLAAHYRFENWVTDIYPTDDEVDKELEFAIKNDTFNRNKPHGAKRKKLDKSTMRKAVYQRLMHERIRKTLTSKDKEIEDKLKLKIHDKKLKKGLFN
ncbi:MAG: peptidylprolyl isomerase [Spirochaetia bacterium]|nr:peptidylprolyl isomerase [Spirochaetia bacterium]